jgi:hypothetical protein
VRVRRWPDGRPGAGAWRELARRAALLREAAEEIARDVPLTASPAPEDVLGALGSDDVRLVRSRSGAGAPAALVYVEGLVDRTRLREEAVRALESGRGAEAALARGVFLRTFREVLHRLLEGWAVLLPRGGLPLGLDVAGPEQRQVEAPSTERAVVGPKEGLVENIHTNIGLIRNRLRDPQLRVELGQVGRRSRTEVALLYLRDVARPDLVAQARRGLAGIGVDLVRTAMDVEELLFARSLTVFPLTEETERPDKIASGLAQGRICLLIDGTPFGVLVPTTFFDFAKDSETAIQGPIVTAFVRALRMLGIMAATLLPAIYVALVTVNVTVLPLPLALALSTARQGVPYPAATETLVILLTADILAEATTQAASAIGNTLAIVGTLIVGQMMVQARLASSLLMIVMAAAVIGSFLTLKYSLSYGLRILKYPLVLLAAFAGFLGIAAGVVAGLVHLCTLKSAGVPYLKPLAAAEPYDIAHYTVVQPTRGQFRLRPAMWRPRGRRRARPGGRR